MQLDASGRLITVNSISSKYNIKNYLLLVLFGSLLPLSMAPFNLWPAGIISVAGFSILICGSSKKKLSFKAIFLRSLSYAIGLYTVGASWIFVSIHNYGQASVGLSLLLITIFILFLSLLFALPFAQCNKAMHTKTLTAGLNSSFSLAVTMLLVFPSLWTLGEWFRGWVFTGFPWLYLGYAHTDTWISGWAPITGVLGLSWITAFSAALLGFLFKLKQQFVVKKIQTRSLLMSLAGGITLTYFFWIGGFYLQKVEWTKATNKIVSIGLMQPAISLWSSWDPSHLDSILAQYREDTTSLLGNDLVVWPEAAIPKFQNEVENYLDSIEKEAIDTNSSVIIGLPIMLNSNEDLNKKNKTYYFNSALALGQGSGVYHKQHLVPFGEYVPFEKWLRGTINFFDLPMSIFNAGQPNQKNITIDRNIAIGTSICYEIAYSELVRKSAKNANLLLTISNDSWFGGTIGPKQHFQIARMRAIENRKPLIRATNNGVSALINADGKIASIIPSYYRNTLEGTLEARNGITPFGMFGSNPILLLSLLLVLVGLFRARLKNS